MPFIIDHRINPTALKVLETFGSVIPLMTEGVTYSAIAGHPDIFFCVADDLLIASEVVPEMILRQLEDAQVNMVISSGRPGNQYPGSAIFNVVVTPDYLIHRSDITDGIIKEHCKGKSIIHVNQAYTRCNLFVPDNRLWITSDRGILKALQPEFPDTLYVDPTPVQLPCFKHGFFAGCCGVFEDKVLVNGSLKHLKEEDALREAFDALHLAIVELHSGPLQDIGGVFWVDEG